MLRLNDTATTGPGERGAITMTARGDRGNVAERGDSPTRAVSHGVSYVECALVAGAILLLLAILAYILLHSAPVQYVLQATTAGNLPV